MADPVERFLSAHVVTGLDVDTLGEVTRIEFRSDPPTPEAAARFGQDPNRPALSVAVLLTPELRRELGQVLATLAGLLEPEEPEPGRRN